MGADRQTGRKCTGRDRSGNLIRQRKSDRKSERHRRKQRRGKKSNYHKSALGKCGQSDSNEGTCRR